jgi:hypothetical protein
MRAGWAVLLAAGALLAGGTRAAEAVVPFYAGGSLPEAAVSGSGYTPTVGVTLVPRPEGRVALAFDTTLRCGRAVAQVRVARTVAWNGATVQAQGKGRAPFAGRPVRFTWALQASADGQTATGTLQLAARRHGRRCRGRAPRGFLAPLMPAAPGAPALPAAASAYSGGGPRLVAGRRPGSVVLRVSPDGSRVAARWAVAARCSHGRPHRLVNLTPPTRIAADGTFARRDRFAVRYADAFVRYRVRFAGRFTGATAAGSLRLRATIRTRRGGAVIARCDTRRRGWSARAAGEAPGQPAPAAPPPAPGGGAPPPTPPDPTFRPHPVVGTWSFDMDSDPGEYIGQGETWHHGSAYGEPLYIDVFAAGDIIQFMTQTRDGNEWTASWSTHDGSPLHIGTYATGAGNPASQGYGGHGRGCGTFTGSFTIDALAYDANGALRTFDVRFEAHCEGLSEALRGAFHFRAA